MNLVGVAQAYSTCVELEERAQDEASALAEDLSILRADLHALLMDALRSEGIPFTDRADAARIAFELTAVTAKSA